MNENESTINYFFVCWLIKLTAIYFIFTERSSSEDEIEIQDVRNSSIEIDETECKCDTKMERE